MNRLTHPFLLLISNSHESQWYKVENTNRMIKIDRYIEEKARFSDREGHSRAGGATGSSLKTNEEWDEETRKNFEATATKTQELWKTGEYQNLVVASPDNVKNQLTEALNLPQVNIIHVSGNFTHENLHHKLLEKIHDV